MLESIFATCTPRPEIQAGELTEEIFAAKIQPVVEGKAPQVYQDPSRFFANTFPTDGVKTLIREVFGRLTGRDSGSPVIRLETSFGGGKTHDQIALFHICQQGRRIQGLERFADLDLIPEYAVQVAAIDGRDLDPQNGIFHGDTGVTTYTLWGEIAYQVGGVRGYELLKGSDENAITPGTSVIERLMDKNPTVIILDEIARHLRAAKAKVVGKTDLAEQVVAFLFSLMDLAASANNLVLVYSLASASDTFADETAELNELMRASARQERVLSPSTDIEIYNIVKQRVFSSVSEQAAEAAKTEYSQAYRGSRLNLPDGCQDSDYAEAIAQSYPFHPELFKLLTQKVASIPDFQRTRGALRLFALVVKHLWQDPSQWIPMIHTHHIPVGVDRRVTDELTSRLQRPLMRLPIQADIFNLNGRAAYAQVQDEQWVVAGKPPFTTWVARTIFLHSLTQGISSGIRRAELNLSVLTPGVESNFVQNVLDTLTKVAWYLDDDPLESRSRFKEEPSINKIIAEEKEQVGKGEAKDELRKRRDSMFATQAFRLVAAPQSPGDVDDVSDSIALCVMDFDDAMVESSQDPAPQIVERIFSSTGEAGKFRTFRNRLLFLMANRQTFDKTVELIREYRAVQTILNSPNRLDDISESQKKQLRDKGGSLDLQVRVSITNAYRHLFYPAKDDVKAPKGLMHYTLTPQDASDVKGKTINQQAVILQALRDCGKVRTEETIRTSPYAPAFVLQRFWPAGLDSITTKGLRDEFAKNLALNMPIDAEIPPLRATIQQGLEQGQWDAKVADRVYIKTPENPSSRLEMVEFSDRVVLYRRGILEPPKPRVVEFFAEVRPASGDAKPVALRWRVREALSVSLFQNEQLIAEGLSPSGDRTLEITQTTTFKIVADYGNGEIVEQVETAQVYGTGTPKPPNGHDTITPPPLFETKPERFELSGTPQGVLAQLRDRASDDKIKAIKELKITVDTPLDYLRLMTAASLLARLKPDIDQLVTVQAGGQFLRLEYQGDQRGFSTTANVVKNFLNQKNSTGTVRLSYRFEFDTPIEPAGNEISQIEQGLTRNPVDRLILAVVVEY
ncbi:ATP-binding protein [Spirulina major]|uniref:ATP-binding protein n=1 Tax=Spirulina major TaxID=270636 RepID=UPI00093477F1|nr:DUF499 domain-containing protein [Spirulina major]